MKIDLSILAFIIFVVLLVCKLTGTATLSWIVVFSPLIVSAALIGVFLLIALIGIFIVLLGD